MNMKNGHWDLRKNEKPMVGFTTAVNSIFVFIIIAAYVFGGHEITAAFGLNLLFYIIITPIFNNNINETCIRRRSPDAGR